MCKHTHTHKFPTNKLILSGLHPCWLRLPHPVTLLPPASSSARSSSTSSSAAPPQSPWRCTLATPHPLHPHAGTFAPHPPVSRATRGWGRRQAAAWVAAGLAGSGGSRQLNRQQPAVALQAAASGNSRQLNRQHPAVALGMGLRDKL
jgi:hypothetical protein